MKTAHAIQQTAVMTSSASVPSSGDVSRDHENALRSGSASIATSTTGTPTMKADEGERGQPGLAARGVELCSLLATSEGADSRAVAVPVTSRRLMPIRPRNCGS